MGEVRCGTCGHMQPDDRSACGDEGCPFPPAKVDPGLADSAVQRPLVGKRAVQTIREDMYEVLCSVAVDKAVDPPVRVQAAAVVLDDMRG